MDFHTFVTHFFFYHYISCWTNETLLIHYMVGNWAAVNRNLSVLMNDGHSVQLLTLKEQEGDLFDPSSVYVHRASLSVQKSVWWWWWCGQERGGGVSVPPSERGSNSRIQLTGSWWRLMIRGRPPSSANAQAKASRSTSEPIFSLSAGRKDGDFIIRSFQAKNKNALHTPPPP